MIKENGWDWWFRNIVEIYVIVCRIARNTIETNNSSNKSSSTIFLTILENHTRNKTHSPIHPFVYSFIHRPLVYHLSSIIMWRFVEQNKELILLTQTLEETKTNKNKWFDDGWGKIVYYKTRTWTRTMYFGWLSGRERGERVCSAHIKLFLLLHRNKNHLKIATH